jgi:hypothetical protein
LKNSQKLGIQNWKFVNPFVEQLIQGVPSIGTHFRFQSLTFLMVLSKKSNSAISTQMV